MKNFKDRSDAGKQLASLLTAYRKNPDAIVIGVIRGGLVTAKEVADFLELPLDFAVARKIGCPHKRETGAGAISSEGDMIFSKRIMEREKLKPEDLTEIIKEESEELKRRHEKFSANRTQQDIRGKTVIVIDDGIAVGVTLKAVVTGLKKYKPDRIILAAPISNSRGKAYLEGDVDEIVTLINAENFRDVSDYYEDFSDTPDSEVEMILSNRKI